MTRIDPARVVDVACALIQCPSVTPAEAGALDLLEALLTPLGFECTRMPFGDVDNLFARRQGRGPCLCYAGHTDVVPTGPVEQWIHPPFDAVIDDGVLHGRGAADMKGSIAAFIAAVARYLADEKDPVPLAFLITGDEEGPAIHGTKAMLTALPKDPFPFDHCLVGEPSSDRRLGDIIKPGRRGSVNVVVEVTGQQGHVAYPHMANNPVHALNAYLSALIGHELDRGYENFQPSSLQVTDLEVGNHAHNVIPGAARAKFNIRFNPNHKGADLVAWMTDLADQHGAQSGCMFTLDAKVTGEAFLTGEGPFTQLLCDAVERATGQTPTLSTGGGTSDARFITNYTPVAELGLRNATIHQIDEQAPVAEIEQLVDIYEGVIRLYQQRMRP
jgi:succinyl-diaminopimelate desuccinylase